MRIVFAGIIGRYPWGGVSWCSLMYLLGLRQLGHEVYYLEDTGECNYDPEANAVATDPAFALRYIDECLRPFGLGERWCYVDYQGGHHGIEKNHWREICRSADCFLVLSGGCWSWRDHYLNIPRKIFVDSDPAFTQLAIEGARDRDKDGWYVEAFRQYDRLFTFGANIGSSACEVPTGDLQWRHTWQPVCCELWKPPDTLPRRATWTTIMTWEIESFRDIGGNKDVEFLKVLPLSRRARDEGLPALELAVNGPRQLLAGEGWRCVEAYPVSADPWRYHAYIRSSRGEFSVAKHTYVRTNSGWFSDRSQCYLASGCPVVVQDTGFSAHLPVGEGLLAWTDLDGAIEALRRVEGDWARHSRAARDVALECFESGKLLRALLDD